VNKSTAVVQEGTQHRYLAKRFVAYYFNFYRLLLIVSVNVVVIEKLLKAEEWDEYGGHWADRVRNLVKYREDNEHCNVLHRYSLLGSWVNTQRTAFKKFYSGKATRMTLQKVKILNYMGFVWDASDCCCRWEDEGWMRMFNVLMEHKEKHGDCLVPYRYEGNPKLGIWVDTQ